MIRQSIDVFGYKWTKARKEHVCWGCERPIRSGDKHRVCTGKTGDGRMFRLRTCRVFCECITDDLNEWPDEAEAWARVHHPTLKVQQ